MDNINDLQYSKKIVKTSNTVEYNDNISIDDVTVIVPTLDEEEAISLVLDDIITHGYENILVVDGNSQDKTLEIVKQKKIPYVTQEGKGKTGAITSALKHIKTPYIALIDGDCTYAAKDIQNMFPYINEYDQVIGARSKGRKNISQLNRFGNWLINTYFNVLFDTKLSDICSGMYLLKTKYAKKIQLQTEGFDVEVEIAANSAKDKSLTEVPIDFFSRVGNQKLNPWKDGLKILTTITKLAFKHKTIRLLSFFAALLLFPGILTLFLFPSARIGMILIVLSLQGLSLLYVDSKFLKKGSL